MVELLVLEVGKRYYWDGTIDDVDPSEPCWAGDLVKLFDKKPRKLISKSKYLFNDDKRRYMNLCFEGFGAEVFFTEKEWRLFKEEVIIENRNFEVIM